MVYVPEGHSQFDKKELEIADLNVDEILLLQDGVDTYLTQYAQLLSGNNLILATYDADLNSGNMILLVTPTYTNTTFKIYGTAVRI